MASCLLLAAVIGSQIHCPEPTYRVQQGDTLWNIAQNYRTDVRTLAYANNLENPSIILVGQELKVTDLPEVPEGYLLPATVELSGTSSEPVTPVVTASKQSPKQVVVSAGAGAGGNIDNWLAQSNWPAQYWAYVKQIAYCESRWTPGISSDGVHYGLMQADIRYWGLVNGPVAELNQAYNIFLQQGFAAWQCA